MRPKRGLTLAEVLATIALLGLAVVLLLCVTATRREEAVTPRCRINLRRLAIGMATYLSGFGGHRFYPCPLGRGSNPKTYNGAEWLASLYWTQVVPDPEAFLCPSSTDSNAGGLDLGSSRVSARFGSQTVSYAGLHYYSLTDTAGNPKSGAIPDDFAPDEPMASDDTQGTINHGTRRAGAMFVLFSDSHVEFKTTQELDVRRAVGQKGGLLRRLRN